MNSMQSHIRQLKKKLNIEDLHHNHKPCLGIAQNCDYCILFGNLFENGSVKYDENIFDFNLVSLKKKQSLSK